MGADQGHDGKERGHADEADHRDRKDPSPERKGAKEPRGSDDPKLSLSPLGMRPSWIHWLLPLVLLSVLWIYSSSTAQDATSGSTIDYSTFYSMVKDGKVESVVLRGAGVRGRFVEAQKIDSRTITAFRTRIPEQEDLTLLPMLREQKVTIQVEDSEASGWVSVLVAVVPWVLILGAWLFLSRRASKMLGSGGSGLAGFVKSAGRKVNRADVVDVTFEDVAGLASAKRDLREVVSFLRNPEPFQRLGGKLPRGVLLVGSPGTGKTLLARAVAGEAGVPFFSISASEFIELFVGVGASRVRDLFSQAKQAAPAIVFIDEIDAVGRSRGTGLGGGHDEREQTLNQLLAEMDGFERSDKVVVLAATNRPDVLDPALLRPGRFDRRVVVELPEKRAREAILEVHTRDKPLMQDVSLDELAEATPGFSGADLANLCNEAALTAVRRGAEAIGRRDFLEAQDKIQLGDPSETRLRPEEKRRVAVHETGHAVVAQLTEGAEPLRRVSIMPRGMALGATQQMPGEDKHLHTVSELRGMLRVLMGGFAAEKLLLGEVSSGAEDDLRKATNLAHKMVAQMGMSDKLGPVYHEHRSEHPFLGQRIASDGGVSDATLHDIELEAQSLLDHARAEASKIIRDNRDLVERMIDRLMTEETLERDALQRLFAEPRLSEPAEHDEHDEHDEPPQSAGRVVHLPRG